MRSHPRPYGGMESPVKGFPPVSGDVQGRSVVSVMVWFYDNLYILIERHEETQKALNRELPELTA